MWSGVVPQQPPTMLTRPSLAKPYKVHENHQVRMNVLQNIYHVIGNSIIREIILKF